MIVCNKILYSTGLGYGSSSEASEGEKEEGDESDSDLEEKIRRKKEAFTKRQRIFSDVEDDGGKSKSGRQKLFIKVSLVFFLG